MSIPHSSDRPCRKVAGQTRGSLRTTLADDDIPSLSVLTTEELYPKSLAF